MKYTHGSLTKHLPRLRQKVNLRPRPLELQQQINFCGVFVLTDGKPDSEAAGDWREPVMMPESAPIEPGYFSASCQR